MRKAAGYLARIAFGFCCGVAIYSTGILDTRLPMNVELETLYRWTCPHCGETNEEWTTAAEVYCIHCDSHVEVEDLDGT